MRHSFETTQPAFYVLAVLHLYSIPEVVYAKHVSKSSCQDQATRKAAELETEMGHDHQFC